MLFVGLALLLALSLAALATAQTTTLELRMAANAAAAEQALFAAEAAVREAEWWLGRHGADPTTMFPAPDTARFASVAYGDRDPWQRTGVWRSAPALGVALPVVAMQPRYLIEYLGSFSDGGTRSRPLPPATIDLFRVTAQDGGGSVLLQTTFGQVRGGGSRAFTGRLSWVRVR